MEVVLDLEIVLSATYYTVGCEDRAGMDFGVHLHPAFVLRVPSALVVYFLDVLVGRVIGEEMWRGNLVNPLDPPCFHRLRNRNCWTPESGKGDISLEDCSLEQREIGSLLCVWSDEAVDTRAADVVYGLVG